MVAATKAHCDIAKSDSIEMFQLLETMNTITNNKEKDSKSSD